MRPTSLIITFTCIQIVNFCNFWHNRNVSAILIFLLFINNLLYRFKNKTSIAFITFKNNIISKSPNGPKNCNNFFKNIRKLLLPQFIFPKVLKTIHYPEFVVNRSWTIIIDNAPYTNSKVTFSKNVINILSFITKGQLPLMKNLIF